MVNLFDLEQFQKLQDDFCRLCHIYAYTLDDGGKRLTEDSGHPEGLALLGKVFAEDDAYGIFKQVSASPLEDIVVVKGKYANVIQAGVKVSIGDATNCWIATAVLKDVTEGKLLDFPFEEEKITKEDFYRALRLLATVETRVAANTVQLQEAQVETRKSKDQETEMGEVLKRTKALTAMVHLLESNEGFEALGSQIAKITGEYLGVSGVKVFQVRRDEESVDMICSYVAKGAVLDLDQTKAIPRSELLRGDKPLMLSSGALASTAIRAQLVKYRLKAFMALPIFVNNKPAMYFCINEQEEDRVFTVDEIKFVGDAAKVLQTLLTGRIQKNSLVGSYASLQEILDNVGTCIYVRDKESGKRLFENRLMKQTFADELKNGTMDMLLKSGKPNGPRNGTFEVHHKDKGTWYDLYQVSIGWIDGRQVELHALYDITDKKQYQTKIEQQAYTDFLTGLYNRMCCERDLATYIDAAKREEGKGAVLYIDLDDFKHINDGLGHQYGDVLLQSISHAFMRVDGVTDTCYRMGGDEFVIIVSPDSYWRLDGIVEDVKEIFAKPWYLKDSDYYCTMSMGICTYPDDGDTVADVIKKADVAMYEAKKKGKNRSANYNENLTGESSKRLDMEKNMRDATSASCGEFDVYFQPILDLQKEGAPCVGAEALVRWNSAALGFVPPADFIPLAEYLGLINPIGTYVLREACYACKKWNDHGHPGYKVNVNLSVVQLLQSDIIDIIKKALRDTEINPCNLTLEVTESLAINDMERMKKILGEIRTLGVRIALDDFGTGYSSLNHIREIPLDVIKVDQSFVADLADDEYSQSFVKMVSELAAAIDVNICIEGIETAEQQRVLEGMKVSLAQGYYFDRPLKRSDFEDKYVN